MALHRFKDATATAPANKNYTTGKAPTTEYHPHGARGPQSHPTTMVPEWPPEGPKIAYEVWKGVNP